MTIEKISAQKATKKCNLELIPHVNLYDLKPNNNIIGQDRAIESIKMAINIPKRGYNIFAMGEAGIGKQKIIYELLNKYGKEHKKLKEWVYVNNFKDIYKPICIAFEHGEAKVFKKQVDAFIVDIAILLQSNFEGSAYRSKISAISETISNKTQDKINNLATKALNLGLSLIKKEESFLIIPLKNKEKPLEEEDFLKLSDEDKIKIESNVKRIKNELSKILNSLPALAQEKNLLIEAHNLKIAQKTTATLFKKILKKWAHNKLAFKYLADAYEYIIENYTIFLNSTNPKSASKEDIMSALLEHKKMDIFNINILLTDEHKKLSDIAPIIFLDNPNYSRLFGKIEYKSQLGMLSTDVDLIKAGALHMANGGYLILNARKILEIPWLWEALKHTIKSGKINFLTPENAITTGSLESLEPTSVDLDVKIILIGEPNIYYQLWEYDPEFKELFKIVADFESKIDYNNDNILPYLQIICSISKQNKLKPLDKLAMGKLIEISSNLAGSQLYLTCNFSKLKNLMIEANYICKEKQNIISIEDITKAFEQQQYRQSRISEQMQKQISDNIINIYTKGQEVGQINGLAVMSINDMHFGIPQRITCSVYKGNKGLINIEKGVQLSGKIHSKGVLILQAYLNERFSKNAPITFSASIVFEQSYGGVDGDSATCAEFLTLVSGLANTPISQALAITGSMDQKGRVQAIGGVNQKIAGFFKSCKQKGLHANNGVVIPKSNVNDLTLDEEILKAINDGLFNIYAIEHIDDAMELFMEKTPEQLNAIILEKWQQGEEKNLSSKL